MSELEWYVWHGKWGGSVEPYNIFDHYRFRKDFVKNVKKYVKIRPRLRTPDEIQREQERKEAFLEEVRRDLMYYFWSKCEYEVIITHWPASLSDEQRF